jgi:L-amino acid N-acyltransferase YncA
MVASIMAPLVQRGVAGLLRPADATGHITDARPCRPMEVRDATAEDWPAIWRFMRDIAAAGETFSWDRDIAEEDARAYWLRGPPARALVAVDADGTVVGTAEMGRRLGGPAAHTASAGFMVDPAHAGRGAGRALGEHVIARAREDGYRSIVFNAVAESNARAVGLWRSLGFEIVGTVPEGFHHPVQGYVGLHVMHRRL